MASDRAMCRWGGQGLARLDRTRAECIREGRSIAHWAEYDIVMTPLRWRSALTKRDWRRDRAEKLKRGELVRDPDGVVSVVERRTRRLSEAEQEEERRARTAKSGAVLPGISRANLPSAACPRCGCYRPIVDGGRRRKPCGCSGVPSPSSETMDAQSGRKLGLSAKKRRRKKKRRKE